MKVFSTLLFALLPLSLFAQSPDPDPELFIEDGLHLNRKGYLLWEGLMNELLTELGF